MIAAPSVRAFGHRPDLPRSHGLPRSISQKIGGRPLLGVALVSSVSVRRRQAWTSLRAIASFLKVALTKPEDHPQVLHEEEDLLVAWKPPKMSMKRPKGGLSEFEAWAHGLDRWVPRSPLLGRGIGGVVLLAREPGDSWKPEATLALLVQGEPSQATLDAAVGGPLRSLRVITASEGLHLGRLSLLEGELLPGRSEKEVRALLAELGHRIIGNGQLCARAAGVRRTFLASVGVRHEAGAFLLAPPPSFQRLLQTDAAALERRSASNWHGRTEHHAGCAVFDGLDLEPKRMPKPTRYTADILVFYLGEELELLGAFGPLLTITRKHWPFPGCLALPGGFVEKNEASIEAASRELQEETQVSGLPLTFVARFDTPNRDPRGPVTTDAFLAFAPSRHCQAGDDAATARFQPLKELATKSWSFDHAEIVAAALLVAAELPLEDQLAAAVRAACEVWGGRASGT
ncbi:unnamed protein product [Effrenium voratum]|uniref:Nudix hydrolase domain-containing protein n=1 Tax=Effrenium voratum TaxID=2562239 RepID=A0AA36IHE2_9DINO|nr:unnamed protein product [Effrenium voratum]